MSASDTAPPAPKSERHSPEVRAAQAELLAWMHANVPEAQHREGSRLIARYLAAAVRQDRATQLLIRKMREIQDMLFDLADKAGRSA